MAMPQIPQNEVFERWVLEAKRLRADSVETRADFLKHLADGEDDKSMWTGAGYTSFAAVLDSADLCKWREYAEFRSAVARYGFAHVRTVGVEPARKLQAVPSEAVSLREPGKLAHTAALADLEDFRVRNKTTPSKQHAETIIRTHYLPPKRVSAMPDPSRMVDLERENARLTKANARLREQLARATAENKKLRDDLREARRSTKAGKRSHSRKKA